MRDSVAQTVDVYQTQKLFGDAAAQQLRRSLLEVPKHAGRHAGVVGQQRFPYKQDRLFFIGLAHFTELRSSGAMQISDLLTELRNTRHGLRALIAGCAGEFRF